MLLNQKAECAPSCTESRSQRGTREKLLCVVLARAPRAFFSRGNEERPTGLTTLTAGKDRQPSGVKKPTVVG
ncbi:hypothetical protein FKK05_19790 [Klebsiella pneumoniae]|nr:hypothetical protein [Klebsiella pneumoniae]